MNKRNQNMARVVSKKQSGRLEQSGQVIARVIVHTLLLIAILIVHGLLLVSCLKENFSNCPEDIRVYFDIATRAGGEDINPADIDRMNLYVFNNKGYYLGEYSDDWISDFSPDYYINCSDLLPGRYRFIAWGGKDERCFGTIPEPFIEGKTKFEDALLTLQHPNDVVTEKVHPLFHSDLKVTVAYEKEQRIIMPLTQQTNTVHISTVGLPADADTYTFEIADQNCSYQFDGSFAVHPAPFKYSAFCTKDEKNQLHSSLHVMRLAADRHTSQLQIYNETTGTILYPTDTQSGDLIELIRSANPNNNFDVTHTYNIVFTFNDGGDGSGDKPGSYTVTIFINGWQVRDQSGELVE